MCTNGVLACTHAGQSIESTSHTTEVCAGLPHPPCEPALLLPASGMYSWGRGCVRVPGEGLFFGILRTAATQGFSENVFLSPLLVAVTASQSMLT